MPGRNSTAAPVFCITLEIAAISTDSEIINREVLWPASLMTGRTIRETRPTLLRPALTTITPMMATTALLLRPVKVSFELSRLSIGSETIIMMATTSTRTHSTTNRKMARAMMTSTSTLVCSLVSTRSGRVTRPLSCTCAPCEPTSGAVTKSLRL